MPFATPEDIATRYGRELTAVEAATAESLILAAMGAIAFAVDKDDDWADELTPVPRIIWMVTVEAVVRAMPNPKGLRSTSETLGAFQHAEGYQTLDTGGIALTDREELMVRRAIYGRTSGSARVDSTATELHDIIYGDCS